jgi:hypothetical protein
MAPGYRLVGAVTLSVLCGFAASAFAQQRQSAPPRDAQPVLDIATEPEGFVAEPDVIRRAALFADRHFNGGERTVGFYADIKNMIPGSGWIGGGPGYRMWYAKDSAFLDTSAGMSWHGYKAAQARFELRKLARSRVAIGSQIKWQDFTQIAYFGEGPQSNETSRSEYRLRSTNVVGYGTFRPVEWMAIDAKLGWLTPDVLPRAGNFMREVPDARQLFPNDPVLVAGDQPAFIHSEASVTADTRDFPEHPTRGLLLRTAMANYADRDSGMFSFRRYEVEGANFLPLAGSRVIVAVRGWLVASDTDEGQVVPFYLEPSLGGNNTLRGYSDYRFHDRHLLLINIETRFALMTHMDAAFLFDTGNVAARVGDLNLDRRSYGGGVRFHTRRSTFARFDVAHSDEGWRAMFSLGDPLSLARVSRRTATAPFVP